MTVDAKETIEDLQSEVKYCREDVADCRKKISEWQIVLATLEGDLAKAEERLAAELSQQVSA